MNENFKIGLTIVVSVIIGLSAFRLIQGYVVMKQIENITTDLAEQSRKRLAASQHEQERRQQQLTAEANRKRALKEQVEFEKNLLCAKNVDTGNCSCYDKRSGKVVNMRLERCNQYVEQQFSSY